MFYVYTHTKLMNYLQNLIQVMDVNFLCDTPGVIKIEHLATDVKYVCLAVFQQIMIDISPHCVFRCSIT
jgi:hypothetical protein